ncbi:MAG: DUF565 domain-containing protein [Oscillatoriaceae bacterium SKW80]|nr:DUF565 domain-containing protein [Oscillatoriaceae bacterium SKYG93]MCX8120264.1 DUF565 domain-containing protein [Oscillatoriaceae bacterium SKW80]MDW8453190.1 DUF565 domain-containing protein [Oscillatoriaceae cyanobacterium SKYGB_i_bin93]HIK28898.1 DUF565 domain-containing protein [Oscillatoriaceae cyanobacterium M7585_C2015_266]
MQNTRLNNLIDTIGERFQQWLRNPWRRTSLLIISLLFGFFLGTAISTVAGQKANLDISVAAILVVLTEGVSWIFYGTNKQIAKSLLGQILNSLKIGLTYSLFVEALKLGS